MKLLALLLLALAAAVALGQLFSHDPGVVMLTYGDKVIRTSLVVGLVVVVGSTLMALLLVRALWRLLTLRSRVRRWQLERARRRRYQNLSGGLLALAEGEYPRAERLLTRDTSDETAPGHLLAAAQAAHAQNAVDRRDRWLALARASTASTLAIDLQQVDMLLAAGDVAAAQTALAPLAARYPKHKQVLDLKQRCLAGAGQWDEFAGLLPRLKRAQVYPQARLTELEAEGAAQLLSRPYASRAELLTAWEKIPKATRSVPIVIAAYATVLIQLNEVEEAEKMLRKALATTWDARLVGLYGELRLSDPAVTVKHAEGWLPQHPEDPTLLLALGRLCLVAELWGKARGYLEASLARAPSALVYRLLAETFEHLKEPALAARHRQLGLEFATGVQGGRVGEGRRLLDTPSMATPPPTLTP
jgi:HemY protein